MDLIIMLILVTVGFVFGLTIGYMISKSIKNEEPIGDLRIDESDPDDGPYLFLELKSKPNNLKSRKQVTLNVKAENYVSQK